MPARNIITFICTANICRSPMAQRLMAHALKAQPEPLRSLQTASAGVSAYGGDAASLNSVRVLESVGIDLRDHVSQRLTQELVDRSFAIFGMTETHKLLVETQFKLATPHLYLMREFMPAGVDKEIPDPYGLDLESYATARDSMVEALPSLLEFLRKEYKAGK